MSTTGTDATAWQAVGALTEPTRRRVFDTLRAAGAPLTRDDVAQATGISRKLAAFHCDQLAAAGLVTVDFARPPGRTGPGAGRPAKRYAVRPDDVAVSIPQRRYDVVARILATAVSAAGQQSAASVALEVAEAEGEAIGARGRSEPPASDAFQAVSDVLADLGYEPVTSDAEVRLRNCPFHAAVDVAPRLVCDLNHRLLAGILRGLQQPDLVATLVPAPPGCCVAITPRAAAG
jgi:predicted ArsR family transcriptional regulator